MKLIRPATVLDAVLSLSDVVETAPSAYNGATTYALGATVSVTAGTVVSVYTSIQAGNTGHTPASSPTWWTLTGTTYSVWSSAVTYSALDIVQVVAADSHKLYRSIAGGNLNNAVTDATKWVDLGNTNRWKMFDQAVNSQTSNPSTIDVTLAIPERADSVALFNCSAAEIALQMTDAVDGLVYNQTYSMISTSGILDWYAYFFEPIERLSDLVVTDLLPYYSADLRILLSDPAETVLCGACVVGLSKDIGGAQYGATVGIADYSVKSTDAFGNYNITQRAFAKRANFTVWTPAGQVDRLLTLLAGYRATPIVYVGSDQYAATAVYGFYKDFNIEIAYPEISVCSLEIEGLT